MDGALRRDQDEPGEFLNLNIGLEKFGGSGNRRGQKRRINIDIGANRGSSGQD